LGAQLWAKSVGAVRLRALPFFLVQQGCLRFGVSCCGLAAAVVGGGVRCFVGVNLSSSTLLMFIEHRRVNPRPVPTRPRT